MTPHANHPPLAVALKPRSHKDGNDFGYKVALARPCAAGHRVAVDLQNQGRYIDVSKRPHNDLIGPDELPRFLAHIASLGAWATSVSCQVWEHDQRGNVVNRFGPVTFASPVKPLDAPRWPGMAAGDAANLVYTKPPGDTYDGSFLWKNDIDGRCYFMHGGKFVTDNERRGFDCITYCGSVFGEDARSGAMAERGDRLADKLHLIRCGLESVTPDEMRARLSEMMWGTYLVWGGTHTVLCHNGVIHEFSEGHKGKRGYNETDVERWHFSGSHWSARKSVRTFVKSARRYMPSLELKPGQAWG